MNVAANRVAVALAAVLVMLVASAGARAATGDVNADGRIDLADALALCRALSGAGGPVADPAAADVDGSGAIDDADVSLLLLAAIGQPLPTRTFSVVPETLDFMDVPVGQVAELDVTLTSQGTLPLTVSAIALDPTGSAAFSLVAPPAVPAVLGPGETLVLTLRYAPQRAGADLGRVDLLTDAGQATVTLVGLGVSPLLGLTPPFIDFGDVPVGGSDDSAITLTNQGTAPLTLQSIAPGPGTSPDFSVGAPGQAQLAAGESTQVSVTYAPAEAGEDAGQIVVLSNGGTGAVGLAGRGVAPELDLVPDFLDFGPVLVAESLTLVLDVRNVGTAPLEVQSILLSMATDPAFSLGMLPALPVAVLPGESLALLVAFSPTGSGPAAGRIDVVTNAGEGMVSLSGAGIRPEITLTPGTADFGNVLVGETAEVAVQLANAGDAPLTVESIALGSGSSGDFSIVSGGGAQFVLDPGGSQAVVLAYSPGEVGPDAGTLVVASDDPTTPLASVPLMGHGVTPEFVIQPASLDFGSVRVGLNEEASFEILNSGTTALTVDFVSVGAGSAAFSLVGLPMLPASFAPAGSLPITVRFAPVAGGPALGRVDVVTSTGAGEVPLSGNGILPVLALQPTSIDFGSAPLSGQVDRSVEVQNLGTSPLILASVDTVSGSDPAFAVASTPPLPATIAPGSTVEIILRFAPTVAGPATGAFRFASDDPARPTVDLPVQGEGLAGGFLGVSPAALDFGELPIGGQLAQDLTLTNVGDDALSILSVGLAPGTSGEFSPSTPSATMLGPGEMATLGVSYAPVNEGTDAGAVEIATSANTVSVSLIGSGAAIVAPVALSLDVTAETLAVGECLKLHATAQFSDGSSADVSASVAWTSGAPAVATVDATGLVQAVSPGPATIVATLGALTAQSAITVVPAGSVRLSFPCGEAGSGGTLAATLMIDSGPAPLGAYAVRLTYDPALIVLTGVAGGPTSGPFSSMPFAHPASYSTGSVILAAWQVSSLTAPTGVVGAARLTFAVTGAPGASGRVGVEVLELVGTNLTDLPSTTTSSRIGVAP